LREKGGIVLRGLQSYEIRDGHSDQCASQPARTRAIYRGAPGKGEGPHNLMAGEGKEGAREGIMWVGTNASSRGRKEEKNYISPGGKEKRGNWFGLKITGGVGGSWEVNLKKGRRGDRVPQKIGGLRAPGGGGTKVKLQFCRGEKAVDIRGSRG